MHIYIYIYFFRCSYFIWQSLTDKWLPQFQDNIPLHVNVGGIAGARVGVGAEVGVGAGAEAEALEDAIPDPALVLNHVLGLDPLVIVAPAPVLVLVLYLDHRGDDFGFLFLVPTIYSSKVWLLRSFFHL